MFEEYEEVRIKASGKVGVIVDKAVYNGVVKYIVEDNEWVNDEYPMYYCKDADLERVSERAA